MSNDITEVNGRKRIKSPSDLPVEPLKEKWLSEIH